MFNFVRNVVRGLFIGLLTGCMAVAADEPLAKPAPEQSALAPRQWRKFAPEGLGFEVILPGEPEKSPATIDTPAGKVYVRVYSVRDDARRRIFSVVVNRFPAAPKPADVKVALDKARDGAVASSQGKLVVEVEAKHGDYAERRWTIEGSGLFVHARVVLAEDRLYQASVVSDAAKLDDEDRRMLDSLQIGKAVLIDPPPKYDWRYVTPEREKYAVEMPGDPAEASSRVATPVGKIDIRQLAWGPPGVSEPRYIVTVSDLPPSLTADEDRRRLDAARDTLLAEDGMKLVLEGPVKIAGRDGHMLVVAKGKHTYHVRLLLVENRLYQLAVVGEAEATVADKRFLSSLKIPDER